MYSQIIRTLRNTLQRFGVGLSKVTRSGLIHQTIICKKHIKEKHLCKRKKEEK